MDWRRGAASADLAFHLARQDAAAGDQPYLDLAGRIADSSAKDENAQEWRSDRIRVKIAWTYALLGQSALASRLEAGVVDSGRAKVDAVRATLINAAAFDEQIKSLDGNRATGSFDLVRDALETCA